MPNNTPTPRTDEVAYADFKDYPDDKVVSADFARTLELELSTTLELVKALERVVQAQKLILIGKHFENRVLPEILQNLRDAETELRQLRERKTI